MYYVRPCSNVILSIMLEEDGCKFSFDENKCRLAFVLCVFVQCGCEASLVNNILKRVAVSSDT